MTNYPYKYMYNLATIVESAAGGSKDPKVWFKAECVSECPAKDTTSKCIQPDGTTTGC